MLATVGPLKDIAAKAVNNTYRYGRLRHLDGGCGLPRRCSPTTRAVLTVSPEVPWGAAVTSADATSQKKVGAATHGSNVAATRQPKGERNGKDDG